jgi:hypothetical protein
MFSALGWVTRLPRPVLDIEGGLFFDNDGPGSR